MNKSDNNIKKRISRRQFIKGAGGLIIAGAAAGILGLNYGKEESIYAANMGEANRQWVLVFDLRLCDGCEQCTKACQKDHYLPKEQEWIKVYKVDGALGKPYFMPVTCMQCENAPCVKVCPVKATYKTTDGLTLIDQSKCIGCRMCMAACPYHARYFNWEDEDYPPVPSSLANSPAFNIPAIKGTVSKCEFCTHLTRSGELPECVRACQMDAVFLGDLLSDVAVNRNKTVKLSSLLQDNDAFRLKEELNTRPSVYYIAGHGQDYVY
ncbi:MAG: 4Fe-4S dicluster domain-containing protein [Dehalococcoidales bacterium]|nr:4Fe-4S dicluster domain-containing protein [Dehalococcoidales bacterium]